MKASPDPKKARAAPKPKAPPKPKALPKPKAVPKPPPKPKPKKTIVEEDSDEDSDVQIVDAPVAKKTPRPSRALKQVVYIDQSDEDDDDPIAVDEDEDDDYDDDF